MLVITQIQQRSLLQPVLSFFLKKSLFSIAEQVEYLSRKASTLVILSLKLMEESEVY